MEEQNLSEENASAKQDRYDLTTGSILTKLLLLSLPTTGTQIVQMAYNLADSFWLGHLNSGAVAASGSVGIFMWLAMCLQSYGAKGTEIGVAQNLGRKDNRATQGYLQNAFFISVVLGIGCGLFLILLRHPLIAFFHIQEPEVVQAAVNYLAIIAVGIPFTYINATISAAFNSSGNSAKPFLVNCIGLVANIVLDPIFIFVMGLGVIGAAIATILCQVLSCVLMVLALRRYKHETFSGMKLMVWPQLVYVKSIFRWATPVAFETFFFTFFILIISRFVSAFGSGALAVQRIGSQVDSMSYMVGDGFAIALTAFIGQNYGAGHFDRIRKGFWVATAIMVTWGTFATLLMVFGNRFIFNAFLPNEPQVVAMGATYLLIIARCQIVACLEGVGRSVSRGMGKTFFTSLYSVLTNVFRIYLAWVLSRGALRQDGIWWAISISAFLRGAGIFLLGVYALWRMMSKKIDST
ncbi:MATE family efflux transporter [Lachnospiraceae bacterium ZAX-1]